MTAPHILMTDPAAYEVAYAINPWMEPSRWDADKAENQRAALKASGDLRRALEDAGATVELIPPIAGLPDLVFPANAAVVLDGKALLARFRCPERAGEEPHFAAAAERLVARGLMREARQIGMFHEGAGDCHWDAARSLFWVGSGPRSDPAAAGEIAAFFGQQTVHLPLATPRFYHLDTCFCPLSGGEILYYPPALTAEARSRLFDHVAPHLLIEATAEDAAAFCVNAVCLGRTIIMATPPLSLRRRLEERGYDVVGVDLAPFILSGGGAFCMTLRLDLKSAGATATTHRVLEDAAT